MANEMHRPDVNTLAMIHSPSESFNWMADSVAAASPITEVLCRGAATDKPILDLAEFTAPGQYASVLFICVVRYLLFKYPGEKLADYFPNLRQHALPKEHAYAAFREFCIRRGDEIKTLISSRTLQLTTAERAAPLLMALLRVATTTDEPLNLIEIGCSAGLLLQFDRYHYDFGEHGKFGDASSPVKIRSELRGRIPSLLVAMPRISGRVGIDLNPQHAAEADVRLWLRATVFPEWIDMQNSMKAALDLAALQPLELIRGDALVKLPEVAAGMSGLLCIYHSQCLYQWPQAARDAIEKIFCELSRNRVIQRISMETTGSDPAQIVLMQYSDGVQVSGAMIGRCDNFGLWTELTNE